MTIAVTMGAAIVVGVVITTDGAVNASQSQF